MGIEIEKITADRYHLRCRGQIITLSSQDLRGIYDWCLRNMNAIEQEARSQEQDTGELPPDGWSDKLGDRGY